MTEVARKYDKLIGLPISTTRSYAGNEGKEKVQKEFRQQIEAFEKWDGDLLMAEVNKKYFKLSLNVFQTSDRLKDLQNSNKLHQSE